MVWRNDGTRRSTAAWLGSLVAVAVIAGSAACAALLDHRRTTAVVGRGVAAATAAGVRVTTDTDEWRGTALAPTLVPLQVTIENNSDQPLRIRHREIWLAGAGGARAAALPTVNLADKNPPVPSRYPYAWFGFHLAPQFALFYRGFWTGAWTFEHDAETYQVRYRELMALMRPTPDMARHALPEGVLESGGYITGMLFFRRPAHAGTLVVDLVDAASANRFGTVEVGAAITD
jgi:hypothetical protein